jgi:bleomycin hydrolase
MAVEMKAGRGLDPVRLARFRRQLAERPERRPLMNAIQKNGIQAVAQDTASQVRNAYTFSVEIESSPITNQRQSGRCWMFAGLNVLKLDVAKHCNLKGFELSQTYQMFWDKLEKANYFLENILETLEEDRAGRLVAWLLTAPLNDGGQWDMFVNLVEKYGVVPKTVMPETFHSQRSGGMNSILTAKLREDAARLREQHRAGVPMDTLRGEKDQMLADFYQMLCHFLGEPPTHFDFEYRDKDQAYHADRGLTPQEFYQRYVGRDLSQYVSIINAPTADKPYGRTFTVQYLGNVADGRPVQYLNVESETLRQACLAQLEAGEVVWFGCDVGKLMDRELGIMDTGLYDYGAALGVDLQLTKADRLDYGESLMTHAMVFTGVNVVDGRPNRWKVENSWGTDPGKDGWFVMSDAWFDEFMYQAVVHREHLTPELRAALNQEPIVLPPWDPMGSLAMMR